jgi:hypothetical protein
MKEIKVKLPPKTITQLTFLAGGRNHRGAYISAVIPLIEDDFTRYHIRSKAHWIGRNLEAGKEELHEIGLKLPLEIIDRLNWLSGGPDCYTRYISALVWGTFWMPAFIQEWVKPKISAPRPNFKAVNSNLPKKSKSPHVGAD